MGAKKAAMILSVVLFMVGLVDFFGRLTTASVALNDDSDNELAGQSVQPGQGLMLNDEQVRELLKWSDVVPEVPVTPVAETVVAVVEQAPPPPPPPPPRDLHKEVQDAITGDVSKQLIGDDLFTLRGIFYDGKTFASLESENILTNVKQQVIIGVDHSSMADLKLVEIGKYHVVLNKNGQQLKLQMFE